MPPRAVDFRTLVKFSRTGRCWEWKGSKNAFGYGRLGPKWAHRLSYEHYVGPITDGLIVRHKCDNPGCVNPAHLELGTALDNARDHQERGYAAFKARPTDRLNNAVVASIRKAAGTAEHLLAFQHGLHVETVRRVLAHG